MQDLAVLRIPDREVVVHGVVPAAFVAVAPGNDARVVHVADHQLADERRRWRCHCRRAASRPVRRGRGGRGGRLPDRTRGSRDNGHAHGVHVHAFISTMSAMLCARLEVRPCRPELMVHGAAHQDPLAVQMKPLPLTKAIVRKPMVSVQRGARAGPRVADLDDES